MNNNDEFSEAIEAGNGGESWKPENEGDVIFGTYKANKHNVGINNSEVYVIQEDGKDEPTSVWGGTVLDSRFEEIPVGSRVKIEYLGKVKGKGPKPYNNYKVVYVPNKDLEGINKAFPGAEVA